MYGTDAPIIGLRHMGSGEHPALMMDLANCSPVQVSGKYLLPKRKKSTSPITSASLPDGRCKSVYQSGGVSHTCSLVDAGSGCLPALLYPAETEGLGIHPPVSAQMLPRRQTAAAGPRSAQDQTPAQMFNPGARSVWSGLLLPL